MPPSHANVDTTRHDWTLGLSSLKQPTRAGSMRCTNHSCAQPPNASVPPPTPLSFHGPTPWALLQAQHALQRRAQGLAAVRQLRRRASVQRQQRQAAAVVGERARQVLNTGVVQQPEGGGQQKGRAGVCVRKAKGEPVNHRRKHEENIMCVKVRDEVTATFPKGG